MKKVLLKNAAATKKFAAKLAKKIISNKSNLQRRTAIIVALIGDLGAGKTTFTQGFAKSLGVKGRIVSPTFLILRAYSLPPSQYKIHNSRFEKFYHADCYRIHKSKDLKILGFKEIFKNPENIVLVEWADRIKKILPKDTIWLEFSHGRKETERLVTY